MQPDRPLRLCLFGAAGDTGNLGVSALLNSTLDSLYRRIPDLDLIVFDSRTTAGSHREIEVDGVERRYRIGVVRSGRRYWRSDNLTTLSALQRAGVRLPAVAEIRRADAVLDLSGGDSFTDMYGPKRFHQIVTPKLIALRARIPLLLLPQTYGEFTNPKSAAVASRILNDPLTTAWSRDGDSHEVLTELARESHDPSRQLTGVDIAFNLRAVPRPDLLDTDLKEWTRSDRDRPVVGINVSGLLYNDPGSAAKYGLTVDYRETLRRLAMRILEESNARIVLVPHVNPRGEAMESDPRACANFLEPLTTAYPDRVAQAPTFADPGAVKWLISSMDWFLGSRMHSTIAALSSDVVAAALAYSMKTAGVFRSCGMESAVVDGRSAETSEAVERLWHLWETRRAQATVLARGSSRVRNAASAQMDDVVSTIERCRSKDHD